MRIAAVVLPLALAAVFAVAWTHRPTQTPWQRAVAAIKECRVSQIQEFRDRKVALTYALDRDRYGQPQKMSLRLVREPRIGAAREAAATAMDCTIATVRG
jgi:hypothetical protein